MAQVPAPTAETIKSLLPSLFILMLFCAPISFFYRGFDCGFIISLKSGMRNLTVRSL